MSAAGRRAIIAGTKKRWAAIKAAKIAAEAPAPVAAAPKASPAKAPVPVNKGGLTAAGRKALSIAMKKRWAAKKKAAAKRKAAYPLEKNWHRVESFSAPHRMKEWNTLGSAKRVSKFPASVSGACRMVNRRRALLLLVVTRGR
jgi:hypothetical protein